MKLYFYGNKSYDYLHNKYHINLRLLEEWHNLVQIWGFKSLKDHNNYHHFDSAFKSEAVKYYLNHNKGLLKVAARFKYADKKKFFKFLDKLPVKDAAKLLATINHIEEHGILTSIKMKWIKKLTHNLYEIRSQVRRNQRRALYFHVKNNHYVNYTWIYQENSENA